VQPDGFVVPLVAGRRPERFADVGRLLPTVEVMSPSTAQVDRVGKRALSGDEGVADDRVVDLEARVVERATPDGAVPEILTEEMQWWPEGASEAFVVDLPGYFTAVLGG
jgi:hypothetical protein